MANFYHESRSVMNIFYVKWGYRTRTVERRQTVTFRCVIGNFGRNFSRNSCYRALMQGRAVRVFLTLSASALCWWPLLIEPNLDLPWWAPLLCVASGAFLATILGPADWLRFPGAAAIGAFSGLCVGYRIWWPGDPIAGAWAPITVVSGAALAGLVGAVAAAVGRSVRLSAKIDGSAVCLALVGCVAYGQTAHNPKDRLRVCDGSILKRHYSGPQFSEEDWRRITGNYVKQDGYFFMLYCRERGGYTIDASPVRNKGDGTRHFCTDESGRLGCGMEFNGSRYACTPCSH